MEMNCSEKLDTYLLVISEVFQADNYMQGWGWFQSVPPQEQVVLLVNVDGEPVAASVHRFIEHWGEVKCRDIFVAMWASGGCSAHDVRFNEFTGVYSAASIEYGLESIAIRDVVWKKDPNSYLVEIVRTNEVPKTYGSPPTASQAA